MKPEPFATIVGSKAGGSVRGLYSVCSSHPLVIEAALRRARDGALPVLVEATSNQVNQFGGYTGMTPQSFATRLSARAAELGVPPGRVIFGGDHLGPFPWRTLPAAEAMDKARTLVRDFSAAGAGKIHLDASMPLRDDPPGALDPQTAVERAADLCAVAEGAAPVGAAPAYVIGTEVPVPGGVAGEEAGEGPAPTSSAALRAVVEAHRAAFLARGLDAAWDRVVAVVAQPGVEFDSRRVYPYDRQRAKPLCETGKTLSGMVLEGHSTDYQRDEALAALVEDGVAILKVGPALTFSLRTALFGLARVAAELGFGSVGASTELEATVEEEMLRDPSAWRGYCEEGEHVELLYGLPDRIRYYWEKPRVKAAVRRLFRFLAVSEPSPALLAQFVPGYEVHNGLASRAPAVGPEELAISVISRELARYERACLPELRYPLVEQGVGR